MQDSLFVVWHFEALYIRYDLKQNLLIDGRFDCYNYRALCYGFVYSQTFSLIFLSSYYRLISELLLWNSLCFMCNEGVLSIKTYTEWIQWNIVGSILQFTYTCCSYDDDVSWLRWVSQLMISCLSVLFREMGYSFTIVIMFTLEIFSFSYSSYCSALNALIHIDLVYSHRFTLVTCMYLLT